VVKLQWRFSGIISVRGTSGLVTVEGMSADVVWNYSTRR
jgi:hypothetical protein